MSSSIHLLETQRTYLRQLTLDDVNSVLEIFSDPEAMKYSPGETIGDRSDAEGLVRWNIENYQKYGFGAWAVIAKSTGKYIGQAGIVQQEMGPEVFYSLIRAHWGQGFATEVASACRDYAFAKMGKRRLIAIIHPQNERAIKVAQKLNMRDAGEIQFWSRVNRLFEIENRA